jgi:hypothetical protein
MIKRKLLAIFILLFVSGCIILLDLSSDLSSDYDSSRYLRIGYDEIIDINNSEGAYIGTNLMHLIYSSELIPCFPYLSAMIKNLIFIIFVFPLIKKTDLVLSPLWWAFVVLPGKEAFIVIAIALWLSITGSKNNIWKDIIRIILGIGICSLSRPQYLALFLFIFVFIYFGYSLPNKRKVGILLLFITLVIASLFWNLVGLANDYVPSGLEVESSFTAINNIRNATNGFDLFNILSRVIIYYSYLIFLPVFEIGRIIWELFDSELQAYHLYQIGAIIEILRQYWFTRSADKNMRLLLVCVLVAGAYSFVHTRYLLPLVLFAFHLKRIKGDNLLELKLTPNVKF